MKVGLYRCHDWECTDAMMVGLYRFHDWECTDAMTVGMYRYYDSGCVQISWQWEYTDPMTGSDRIVKVHIMTAYYVISSYSGL